MAVWDGTCVLRLESGPGGVRVGGQRTEGSCLPAALITQRFCVSTGAASLICAEVLRQENFPGRIIMATRDKLLPYDKTRLSKVWQCKKKTSI